ncbi:helix-turn-helix domain-containing protein [Mucilaginibacter ginsenosidivorax]|uniref:Helix-turn-helix transcriptional regulator n=1 Tax=Mucilaginibacter ginsenosidivorax TaxID=862126 RepID=A0A5B8W8H3_9SPHI|nr:helix-turn-helix transcriptional regulator [Mucilaginibacter ginsenosidivorax]QEC78538.1 helix-turn-helix transcriptional regulator [Mucilaginibacter ginsenosidivorax]
MTPKTQTIDEFYRFKFDNVPFDLHKHPEHFNVFRTEDYNHSNNRPVAYVRRAFYKISLIRGEHIFHYADKSLRVSGTALMFFNPQVPYTLESLSETNSGFFCIFSKNFFTESVHGALNQLPMFAHGGKPAYLLDPEQDLQVSGIYSRMLWEIRSDYAYKYDLLRNYIAELTHFALKSRPSEILYQHPNAKRRITAVFTELLERQFPIENSAQRFNMRSPSDFAVQLAVHVNHLNRAVKDTTGKTTTNVIAERLVSEAKSLLKHTNWNISEIGYCLGFEDPAHFNNFFKKQTCCSPSVFRGV